jgi:ribosomal protein S4
MDISVAARGVSIPSYIVEAGDSIDVRAEQKAVPVQEVFQRQNTGVAFMGSKDIKNLR